MLLLIRCLYKEKNERSALNGPYGLSSHQERAYHPQRFLPYPRSLYLNTNVVFLGKNHTATIKNKVFFSKITHYINFVLTIYIFVWVTYFLSNMKPKFISSRGTFTTNILLVKHPHRSTTNMMRYIPHHTCTMKL